MTNQISVHFAGDSGDGMQLLGQQFTYNAMDCGWVVRTLPDFPAEIRAPQGTKAGVSGFMASLSADNSYTVADKVDVLVALNPAALVASLSRLKLSGLILINRDAFKARDLKKAGLEISPLDDGSLKDYQIIDLALTSQTLEALSDSALSHSEVKKTKNFFVLGIIIWLFELNLADAIRFIANKFQKKSDFLEANTQALQSGYNLALTLELPHIMSGKPSLKLASNTLPINGSRAIALAIAVAAVKTNLSVLLSGYPITPASNIMHEFAKFSASNLKLFQAEDEIAALGAVIGGAFAGLLGVTCTSGPGLDLKSEGLGLAVMTELPMVIIDVQRAGPSTGLPTKPEQSDLLHAIYGRHGEAPLPVLAAKSPSDCFYVMLDAFQLAMDYMTPVIVLSDAYLANAQEQWQKPELNNIQLKAPSFNRFDKPFMRDNNFARSWNIPGSVDKQHTLGGLEKNGEDGGVSYAPTDHQKMVEIRQKKISAINIDNAFEFIGDKKAPLLVVSWGSTYGSVREAVSVLATENKSVAMLHLRQVYPLSTQCLDLVKSFSRVIVCELNSGQLCHEIRAATLIDAVSVSQVNGQPFQIETLTQAFREHYEHSKVV